MFDASEKSLLKNQVLRFRWLLWCFLPSLVLIWLLLLFVPVLPEHWVQTMDSSFPDWVLWVPMGSLSLTVILSFFVNGIIVFKALGERFRLPPLPRAVITAAVILFVFPAMEGRLSSPFKHLMLWFRSIMDGVLASNQTTPETSISVAMVISAQLLSLMAMIAVLPLILILVLALFKRPHHSQSETQP